MRSFAKFLLVLSCICLVSATGWAAEETRTVVDGRGVEVQIPAEIERVVTASHGFIEEVMLVLGEEEKIIGVGTGSGLQDIHNCTYQTVSGKTYEYRGGMYPATYLYPKIRDLPGVGEGVGMNYEMLAGLEPDLMLIRVGSCGFPTIEDERMEKTIRTIEAMGIPVIVLKSPTCFDKPDLSTISEEIRILGAVFGKEKRAVELAEYLESQTKLVFERTRDIPDAERPKVLAFFASPNARKAGGTGNVQGTDTIDSYFIEELVHAKNAYRGTGQPMVSAEQLLSLDPDVILLYTAWVYHPAEELYSAPYYQNIGEVSAVKNRRIMSLPYPTNCGKRLEYPIEVMVIAKAAYPDRFDDVDLGEWLLEFYENVYGVDLATAEGLRSAQLMDWTVKSV